MTTCTPCTTLSTCSPTSSSILFSMASPTSSQSQCSCSNSSSSTSNHSASPYSSPSPSASSCSSSGSSYWTSGSSRKATSRSRTSRGGSTQAAAPKATGGRKNAVLAPARSGSFRGRPFDLHSKPCRGHFHCSTRRPHTAQTTCGALAQYAACGRNPRAPTRRTQPGWGHSVGIKLFSSAGGTTGMSAGSGGGLTGSQRGAPAAVSGPITSPSLATGSATGLAIGSAAGATCVAAADERGEVVCSLARYRVYRFQRLATIRTRTSSKDTSSLKDFWIFSAARFCHLPPYPLLLQENRDGEFSLGPLR